jgi:hypothetical protein
MIDLRKLKIKNVRLKKYIPFKKFEASYKYISHTESFGYVIDIILIKKDTYKIKILLYNISRRNHEELIDEQEKTIHALNIDGISKVIVEMLFPK